MTGDPTSRLRRFALAILAGSVVGVTGAAAELKGRLTGADLLGFLVECIGTDEAGRPRLGADPATDCAGGRRLAEPARWRKHDWPDQRTPSERFLGQQASDSVLDERYAVPVVVQTFDHGHTGYAFNHFDRPSADGGDVATVLDGAAWIFFTEDGENGGQWFTGAGCGSPERPTARFQSWLLFGDEVAKGEWRERMATYRMTRSAAECPTEFRFSRTRFRRDTMTVPFRIVDGEKPVVTGTHEVDAIVSEHVGGKTVEEARQFERFYFGRGLGKFRWEGWAKVPESRFKNAPELAAHHAASGRCAKLPHSEPPGERWVMIDCRTWTNFVRQSEPWSVADFGWPGAILDVLPRAPGPQ